MLLPRRSYFLTPEWHNPDSIVLDLIRRFARVATLVCFEQQAVVLMRVDFRGVICDERLGYHQASQASHTWKHVSKQALEDLLSVVRYVQEVLSMKTTSDRSRTKYCCACLAKDFTNLKRA